MDNVKSPRCVLTPMGSGAGWRWRQQQTNNVKHCIVAGNDHKGLLTSDETEDTRQPQCAALNVGAIQ
jgi:hypothetical protein